MAIFGALKFRSVPHLPQSNQDKPDPSKFDCAKQALASNWKGLALDAAGWAVNFAFPEAPVATAIAGSIIGLAGIEQAVSNNNGTADGLVSGSIAYTGKQAAVAEGLMRGAGSALSHRIGVGALTASSLYDVAKTVTAYNQCMAGK